MDINAYPDNSMAYDPNKHHRRSIRLKGHDYSLTGTYFITICTHQREQIFGVIENGVMQLNEFGHIVAKHWQWLSIQYPYVTLGEWVVMPNHMHGILVVTDTGRGGSRTAPTINPNTPRASIDPGTPRSIDHATPSIPLGDEPKRKPLGRLIGAFKTVSTKEINQIRNTPAVPIWQRNYYEHIIRDKKPLDNIRRYIQTNPQSWDADQLHPENPSKW
jgi:putative transposase